MPKENSIHGKSLARLMAVQVLYSHELVGGEDGVEEVLSRVMAVEAEKEGGEEVIITQSPDKKLLSELVKGVIEEGSDIDELISKYLKKDWVIERIDNLLLSILRTATYEIKEKDTDVKVILDEYINIAHSFYEMQEVGFINGILDSIANEIRKDG